MAPNIRRLRPDPKSEALQVALGLLEDLRVQGVPEAEARRSAAQRLSVENRRLFHLAAGLASARAGMQVPAAPDLRERFSVALSQGPLPLLERPVVVPLRNQTWAMRTAAIAACFVLFMGLGRGALTSLPGDPLYGTKDAGRSARLGLASGVPEALLRIGFAEDRYGEVDSLIARSRTSAIGLPGDVLAATAGQVRDPRISRLIRSVLRKASADLEAAARVLIKAPQSAPAAQHEGLVKLAAAVRKGQKTVSRVSSAVPALSEEAPAVIVASSSLEKVEAEVEKALAAEPAATPTPDPCATPTPAPAASPSPTPTTTPTPTPTPKPTPKPTPGATEKPTPTPTPSTTPDCSTPSPEPSASPDGSPATATPSASEAPEASPEAQAEAEESPDDQPRDRSHASCSTLLC